MKLPLFGVLCLGLAERGELRAAAIGHSLHGVGLDAMVLSVHDFSLDEGFAGIELNRAAAERECRIRKAIQVDGGKFVMKSTNNQKTLVAVGFARCLSIGDHLPGVGVVAIHQLRLEVPVGGSGGVINRQDVVQEDSYCYREEVAIS